MYRLSILLIGIIQLVNADVFLGKIVDSSTGMPIVEANIKLKHKNNEGTVTDPNGVFSFSGSNGDSALIEITAIGYTGLEKMVLLSEPRAMIIKLEQSAIKLSPINVLADRSRNAHKIYRIP